MISLFIIFLQLSIQKSCYIHYLILFIVLIQSLIQNLILNLYMIISMYLHLKDYLSLLKTYNAIIITSFTELFSIYIRKLIYQRAPKVFAWPCMIFSKKKICTYSYKFFQTEFSIFIYVNVIE